MKAICLGVSGDLEIREVPRPDLPPAGHLLVEIAACAINHGDKFFLQPGSTASLALAGSRHDIWGASGAGRVVAVGVGVPEEFEGRQVAIYRSLGRGGAVVGVWSELAQIPYTACVLLPETLSPRDYSGSLVNVFTAYAFLDEIVVAGHKGVVVTGGTSSTGGALVALGRARGVKVISLVRTAARRDELRGNGIEHVLATSDAEFDAAFSELAADLGTTAVFDGIGGDLVSRIAPLLPVNSTIHVYGALAGLTPVSFPTGLILRHNLALRRFSNFETATARDSDRLAAAMSDLATMIAGPMFRTRIGREFGFDQIAKAMAYEAPPGFKAVLVP